MNNHGDLYLAHHGIKGMHWGVRRYEDANGHLTPAGKRRYGIQDARKYYKINRLQRAREKTNNKRYKKLLDGEIRRVKTRSDRKHADLSKRDINTGREIVAKNRLKWAAFNTVAKTALTAAGAAYLYQNPKTRALAPLAIAGGAALTAKSAKKVPYYFMENRRYKQVNEKGSTKNGLTKKQQRARKIGKAALAIGTTAAVAGTSAYLLNKARKNSSIRDTISKTSRASQAVYAANKKATASKKRKEAASRVYSGVKTTISNAANAINSGKQQAKSATKDAVKNVGRKAANSVKERIIQDVDYDDAMSYIKTVTNTINTGREVKSKIDDILAGGERAANVVTEETVNGISALIDKAKNIRLPKRKNKE